MKYDVKTSEIMFLLIMPRKYMSKWNLKKYFYIYKTNTWTNKRAF